MTLEAVLVDHAIDSRSATEMQKESHFKIRRAQVAEQLCRSIGMQPLRRFGLENELLIDYQVECLAS